MPGQRLGALVVVLGLSAGCAQIARAQGASFTVNALVFQPLSVLGDRNLGFGNVFPGVNKTIPAQSANAGRYQVSGENNANISLSFTLPASLVNGANLLPINSWTGRHNTTNAANPGGIAFTPSGSATSVQLSTTGQRWVFIGATVAPAVNQAAGTYTATATLTVAYL